MPPCGEIKGSTLTFLARCGATQPLPTQPTPHPRDATRRHIEARIECELLNRLLVVGLLCWVGLLGWFVDLAGWSHRRSGASSRETSSFASSSTTSAPPTPP